MSDIIRVLRVVEFVGERAAVEAQLTNSNWTERLAVRGCLIKAATLGATAEVLAGTEKTLVEATLDARAQQRRALEFVKELARMHPAIGYTSEDIVKWAKEALDPPPTAEEIAAETDRGR